MPTSDCIINQNNRAMKKIEMNFVEKDTLNTKELDSIFGGVTPIERDKVSYDCYDTNENYGKKGDCHTHNYANGDCYSQNYGSH